jgi:CrcB protein
VARGRLSSGPGARAGSLAPHPDRGELVAVFAGGCLGGLLRAALLQTLTHRPDQWPWATFLVNILGALLLGCCVAMLRERSRPSRRRPFLIAGVCGALTTFSTMMVELLRMIDGRHWTLAAAYTAASVLGGLAAVSLSIRLLRRPGIGT